MAEVPSALGAPDVTVVIVSYNTRELLIRCLERVHQESAGMALEVRVIDNASSDGSAEAVAARWPSVVLVRNDENRGYAPACNQGLTGLRSKYVLALNSDAFLHAGALPALVSCLDAHPDAAAAGPKLLNANGSTQWVCARREPRFLTSLITHTQVSAYLPGLAPFLHRTYDRSWYDHAGEVEVLSGACILFRRAVLERIGILDARLVLSYDDVEWCLRARRRGWRLRYEPRAEVTHLGGASRPFDAESNSTANVRSTAVFWDLAFHPPAAAALKLTLLASIGLSWAKNRVLAAFAPAKRPRTAHLARLLRECGSALLRPAVEREEGVAWRRGRAVDGRAPMRSG